jgi:hypothetical protein
MTVSVISGTLIVSQRKDDVDVMRQLGAFSPAMERERQKMYYRVAIRVDSLSTWQWKSTVLSELSTLFLFLRRYGPLQLERLRVFSSPSREGLEEQLVQQNEGLLSPSVTAKQFLHERLIQTPGMKQATPVCVGGASQQMASIAIVAESSMNESSRQGTDLVGRSHSALESRRLALELGPGGDHDVPYHFVMPASLLPVLAWMRLLARIEQGELQP